MSWKTAQWAWWRVQSARLASHGSTQSKRSGCQKAQGQAKIDRLGAPAIAMIRSFVLMDGEAGLHVTHHAGCIEQVAPGSGPPGTEAEHRRSRAQRGPKFQMQGFLLKLATRERQWPSGRSYDCEWLLHGGSALTKRWERAR